MGLSLYLMMGEIPRAIPCNSSSQLGSTAEKEYGEGHVELDRREDNLGILLNSEDIRNFLEVETALDSRFKLNTDGDDDDDAVGVWDRIRRDMMTDSEHKQSTEDNCGEGSDVRTMWSEKRHENDEVEEEDENQQPPSKHPRKDAEKMSSQRRTMSIQDHAEKEMQMYKETPPTFIIESK
ncbi:unnamed protein product [Leuciscus chuanchicus]